MDIQEADGTTETIRTTDEHPFWVTDVGWVKAGDLQVGQHLVTSAGQVATLTATRAEEHPEGITVYNFTVDQDHTYFVTDVADDDAVWVHNENGPATPPSAGSNPGADEGPGQPKAPTSPGGNLDSLSNQEFISRMLELSAHPNPSDQDMENQLFDKFWRDKMAQEQMERDYQAGYDRAQAAGHSAPDPKLGWVPVVGSLSRAWYEYQAGHSLGATMQLGSAVFEAAFVFQLAKGSVRPSAETRGETIRGRS